jgi:hypothetical protein
MLHGLARKVHSPRLIPAFKELGVHECQTLDSVLNKISKLHPLAVVPYFSIKINIIIVMTSSTVFLVTDLDVRVRFLELPDFMRSSGSATGSTQPREYN